MCSIQLIISFQCTETGSLSAKELAGLECCREQLKQAKVLISNLTTDMHTLVRKYMETKWTGGKHHSDIWHIAKGSKHVSMLICLLCIEQPGKSYVKR